MPEGTAGGGVLTGHVVEMSTVKERVYCRTCGSDRMHRKERKGILQLWIYPLFGYYPWRCNRCGAAPMLRKRRRAKYKDHMK